MDVEILSVKPFREMYALEVRYCYSTGMWLWKQHHEEAFRLVTRDGTSFHMHPGEDREYRNMPIREELQDLLYDKLQTFLKEHPDVAEQLGV